MASRAPKHQNKFAFRHNPHSKKTQQIANIPNVGLCQKCHDIIEWKKKFRKYKPITQPKKCVGCQQKTVRLAYHIYCLPCSQQRNVCPKCNQRKDIVEEKKGEMGAEELQEILMNIGMKERHRRTIWRYWENSKYTDDELMTIIKQYDPNSVELDGDDDENNDGEDGKDQNTKNNTSEQKPMTPAVAAAQITKQKEQQQTTKSNKNNQHNNDEDDEGLDDDDDDFEDEDDDDFDDDDDDDDIPVPQQPPPKPRGPPPKPKPSSSSSSSSSSQSSMQQATDMMKSVNVQ